MIIAPDFTKAAAKRANQLEVQLGVDIRLVHASTFKRLARHWQETYVEREDPLPLSVFYGSNTLDLGTTTAALETMFS